MTNEPELKPCAFCKFDGHIWREQYTDLSIGDEECIYYIKCNMYGGRSSNDRSLVSAINSWNTRDAKKNDK